MSRPPGVRPARRVEGRSNTASSYCPGCNVRLTIGEPVHHDTWPSYLKAHPLSPMQYDALLQAAAEYRDLCAAVEYPERAVDFADWIEQEATGRQIQRYDADGRYTVGGEGARRVSEPFPLPVQGSGDRRVPTRKSA